MNYYYTHIRKTAQSDLIMMQNIGRRTIDSSYRLFIGDEGVDWYINSGKCDKEITKYLTNSDILLMNDKIVAMAIYCHLLFYFDDFIHLMMVDFKLQHRRLGTKLLQHTELQLKKASYEFLSEA